MCWGLRPGVPSAPNAPSGVNVPTGVMDSVPMRAVAMGSEGTSCALALDGVLRCWGRNDAYQLGFGPIGEYPTPRQVSGDERYAATAIGFHDACAIATDGVPLCWGEINRFLTGLDTIAARPTRIAGTPPLEQVATMYWQACGLTATGETWCWGYFDSGLSAARVLQPTRVTALPPLRSIVGTYAGFCGIASDGQAWCWADRAASLAAPTRWGAPHRFRQLDVARDGAVCGISTNDEVLCTGTVPTP